MDGRVGLGLGGLESGSRESLSIGANRQSIFLFSVKLNSMMRSILGGQKPCPTFELPTPAILL